MNIQKTVTIKEVAKARDKLLKTLAREKEKGLSEKDEQCYENLNELNESLLEWFYEEVQEAFDFDGEEDTESGGLVK